MLKPMGRWAEPPIMEGKKVESLGNESFPGALRSFGSSNELPAKQSRQSFRHTLADAIFLTPLALLAVPTFEFFSDVLHWRAHGHGRWVPE